MTADGQSARPRDAAMVFIFITVLLDMLSLGIIIPVWPRLVVNFLSGDNVRAAEIFGQIGTAWAAMQFVFSPIQGALSDRFGRRPIILLSNLGEGLDYFVMAWAPSLAWLLLGRLVSGATAASISSAYAYIADVTPPEKRAGRYGLLGAAFGIGFVLGPAVGGLLGELGPRIPFWFAGALSLANFAYGFFVLPESLAQDRRRPFLWGRANPVASLVLLRSHPELWGLAIVYFLGQLAHVVLPSTFVLYAGYRYGWTEWAVGLTLAGVGICSAVVQAGLVRRAVAWFGERRALMIGLACGAVGFAIYGIAPNGFWFLIGIPIMSFWGFANPATQGLMTRLVGATEQGQLQGANSSMTGIAGMIGPSLFTLSFAFVIDPARSVHVPGTPFLLASAMLVAALVLVVRASGAAPVKHA
ncbi:MAG TPA: TCR/Tet family MFS transporter [Candidatus Polarisedimenticolia bacterium]|nr:TCR/Tet family MFS transporter [Candidatus Polarisedimenticolia bacterium]